MTALKDCVRPLPGFIAMGIIVLVTSMWTLWGMGEMYYEGWGLPFPTPLRYLLPAAEILSLAMVAATWPRVGGSLLILGGTGFSVWWIHLAAARGWLRLSWIVGTLFPLAGAVVLVGVLFLFEGRHRRQLRAEGWVPPASWLRRNCRYWLMLGAPLLVALGATTYWAPLLLTRMDDGDRGVRFVEGNGVTLVWAPLGPGWNWKQDGGGYPGWDRLALYGLPPVGLEDKPGYQDRHAGALNMATTGLCQHLSEDGSRLMSKPQNVWRMPTTDEIVRSLTRRGENARCTWDGERGSAECLLQPNKDTPLWASEMDAVYYWSADEYDEESAWYVPYTGGIRYGGAIGHQPKNWGNLRHGYRCVRKP